MDNVEQMCPITHYLEPINTKLDAAAIVGLSVLGRECTIEHKHLECGTATCLFHSINVLADRIAATENASDMVDKPGQAIAGLAALGKHNAKEFNGLEITFAASLLYAIENLAESFILESGAKEQL